MVPVTNDPSALAHPRHELRTPLNHIIGYSEMLLEDAETDRPALVPGLRQVHDAGRELLGLVNDVLSPARVAAGATERPRLAAVLGGPLDRIVTAVETLRKQVGESGDTVPLADLERIVAAATHLLSLLRDEAGTESNPRAASAFSRRSTS